ncbi:hypothetical protein [Vallitalea maricola]|uniref:Uncharacterized protein n=1 Tax=Vallitalea maricola TaxID=3074433 RepID=A0ACB5UKN3_9FIRM|nr:hypothetical protein AN2V17_27550 [Vallitalea sp. AN17-2]
MKEIFINLENCYGISNLTYTFTFNERKKAHLIYAPNGVMKTSFANTIKDIYLEQETKDCFYPSRNTIREVKFNDANGVDITKDDVLVIEPYLDNYKSDNVSILLADEDLKKDYENIHKDIQAKMDILFKNINKLSGKRNSENILLKDFGLPEKEIYDCIEKIYIDNKDSHINKIDIKYSKIITPDSEKILLNNEVQKQLQAYIEQYEKLLTNSSVFKKSFNHNNAEDVLRILKKDGFFKAKHQVIFANTGNAIGEKEYKKIIDDEKKRILDEELSEEFDKIDKLLSAKTGTKELRDIILNNREIIPELLDLPNFKRKLWISYLFNELPLMKEAIINYQNNRKKLTDIVKLANEQSTTWNKVVTQFNERFSNMPFKLMVTNKDDVILKSELPAIAFKYEDRGEETEVEEENLLRHLSNGEKKALYLLNVIFEIQARKELNKDTFLIIDDLADSFDYRNKYAIIEYIKEIVDNEIFFPIILTHNFDFYRTVSSRIGIQPSSNFVNKNEVAITLEHGQYTKNVFANWRNSVYNNDKIFLSSIAFVRNISEYIKGTDNIIYKNLTNLLHYKQVSSGEVKATEDILVQDLFIWYNTIWERKIENFTQNSSKKVVILLSEVAEQIVNHETNSINIENKIVLSIAIRHMAEKYMINRINNNELVNGITRDQTRNLRNMINFNKDNPEDIKIEEIIERVLIITSENIHINSFMYEPIVDMSLEELINLYNSLKGI